MKLLLSLSASVVIVTVLLVVSLRSDSHAAPRAARAVVEGLPDGGPAATGRPLPAPAPSQPDGTSPEARHRRDPAPLVRPRPVPRSTVAQFAKARAWDLALRRFGRLPKNDTPQGIEHNLSKALPLAGNPVSRQNIIFLAVLTLPLERARPWLLEVADAGDVDDREDVTCALAFSGDEGGRGAFRSLPQPSGADVHRLVDGVTTVNEISNQATPEARRILRSYRCIEVLDRDPYFDIVGVELGWSGIKLAWLPHPLPGDELPRELLDVWLRRYPGHPGGDDMAWRLGRIHTRAGRHLLAARWYSRAATMPDQDVTTGSIMRMLATAELFLTPAEIDRLAHERGMDTPNRRLLRYAWIRKIAARQGFAEALRLADAFARSEPGSPFGQGWRMRFAPAPPAGLDSGLRPLQKDDPLRTTLEIEELPPMAVSARFGGYYTDFLEPSGEELRLKPPTEVFTLDRTRLARQFRAWETLAELERRARRARGAERGDLFYKQAAVFYHTPSVLFPAYGSETENFGYWIATLRGDMDDDAVESAEARFREDTYATLRAIELFRRVERENPTYPGMDKVLYSLGLAHRKLIDYRPMRRINEHGSWRAGAPRTDPALMRGLVRAFERCAREHPSSSLAAPAAQAAAWWRRQQ